MKEVNIATESWYMMMIMMMMVMGKRSDSDADIVQRIQ